MTDHNLTGTFACCEEDGEGHVLGDGSFFLFGEDGSEAQILTPGSVELL